MAALPLIVLALMSPSQAIALPQEMEPGTWIGDALKKKFRNWLDAAGNPEIAVVHDSAKRGAWFATGVKQVLESEWRCTRVEIIPLQGADSADELCNTVEGWRIKKPVVLVVCVDKTSVSLCGFDQRRWEPMFRSQAIPMPNGQLEEPGIWAAHMFQDALKNWQPPSDIGPNRMRVTLEVGSQRRADQLASAMEKLPPPFVATGHEETNDDKTWVVTHMVEYPRHLRVSAVRSAVADAVGQLGNCILWKDRDDYSARGEALSSEGEPDWFLATDPTGAEARKSRRIQRLGGTAGVMRFQVVQLGGGGDVGESLDEVVAMFRDEGFEMINAPLPGGVVSAEDLYQRVQDRDALLLTIEPLPAGSSSYRLALHDLKRLRVIADARFPLSERELRKFGCYDPSQEDIGMARYLAGTLLVGYDREHDFDRIEVFVEAELAVAKRIRDAVSAKLSGASLTVETESGGNGRWRFSVRWTRQTGESTQNIDSIRRQITDLREIGVEGLRVTASSANTIEIGP